VFSIAGELFDDALLVFPVIGLFIGKYIHFLGIFLPNALDKLTKGFYKYIIVCGKVSEENPKK
jgi:hypothetical protein